MLYVNNSFRSAVLRDSLLKAKFHYGSWFEAGSKLV